MEKLVFVSHSRDADGKKADAVVDYLESRGIGCFIAPRDITGGTSYAPRLVAAIKAASVILLIGSPAVNSSEHILNEIEIAVNHHKDILHFVIEDYIPSDDLVYYISRKQKLFALNNDYKSFLPNLEKQLRELLNLPDAPEKTASEENFGDSDRYKVFQYLPDRGIMINPSDRHRNVSFRSDTFLTLFSQIYDSVAKATDPESAEEIFRQSGYTCGANFGRRLQSTMDEKNGYRDYTPEEKIARWCEFDSNVGWGKFSSQIRIDTDAGTIDGKLSISECFLMDKSSSRRPVCAFVRGYCEAVMSALLGVQLRLTCKSCPYIKKFSNTCEFEVSLA